MSQISSSPTKWNARRILKELTDSEGRRRILTAFWKHAEEQERQYATMQLAKVMHFRDDTVRRMPPEKKADLLASRIGSVEFEPALGTALMLYHTHEQTGMMAAFLDVWKIHHKDGSIEDDDYTTPTSEQVREAVRQLESRFTRSDMAVYLATAGLLMGDKWEEGTWPVVGEML